MTIAFYLTMPGRNTWNGKWTGDSALYARTRSSRSREGIENFKKILDAAPYFYQWDDGWCAHIEAKQVDSKEAVKLRRASKGFCGYDWMINTIILYGKPLNSVEVSALNEQKK